MNFVVYCHIFRCICIIYNFISMYLIVFGDFPKDPPYIGYTSAGQENPILCIFWTQIDRGFFEDQYFPNYDDTKLWNHANGVTKGKRLGVARPTLLGAPPGAFCSSEHRSRPIKAPKGSLDLKNPLYKGARGVSWRRRRVDQKHRNSARTSHHRRGTLLRSRHRRDLLPLQDQDRHHHDEKGVVHLWTMGLLK